MRAEPQASVAKDVVTNGELSDGRADSSDLSCKLAAEDRLPRPADARDEAAEDHDHEAARSVGFASVDVQPVDRCGAHLDQHLVLIGDGLLDLVESQDLRRPVSVVDNGSHRFPFPLSVVWG